MENEYISLKQTKEIMRQYQEIISTSLNQIEQSYNKFFSNIENEWEDKYAYNFSNELIESINNLSNEIINISKLFNDKLIKNTNIDNNNENNDTTIPSIIISNISLTSNIKEIFADNQTGFKNTESLAKLSNSLSELHSELENNINNTTNILRSINVYGNNLVTQDITIISGKVVETLQKMVEVYETLTKKYLKAASEEYASK